MSYREELHILLVMDATESLSKDVEQLWTKLKVYISIKRDTEVAQIICKVSFSEVKCNH